MFCIIISQIPPEIKHLDSFINEQTHQILQEYQKTGRYQEIDQLKKQLNLAKAAKNQLENVARLDFSKPSKKLIETAEMHNIDLNDEEIKNHFRNIQQQNILDIRKWLAKQGYSHYSSSFESNNQQQLQKEQNMYITTSQQLQDSTHQNIQPTLQNIQPTHSNAYLQSQSQINKGTFQKSLNEKIESELESTNQISKRKEDQTEKQEQKYSHQQANTSQQSLNQLIIQQQLEQQDKKNSSSQSNSKNITQSQSEYQQEFSSNWIVADHNSESEETTHISDTQNVLEKLARESQMLKEIALRLSNYGMQSKEELEILLERMRNFKFQDEEEFNSEEYEDQENDQENDQLFGYEEGEYSNEEEEEYYQEEEEGEEEEEEVIQQEQQDLNNREDNEKHSNQSFQCVNIVTLSAIIIIAIALVFALFQENIFVFFS